MKGQYNTSAAPHIELGRQYETINEARDRDAMILMKKVQGICLNPGISNEMKLDAMLSLRMQFDPKNAKKYSAYAEMYRNRGLTAYWALDMISSVSPAPDGEYARILMKILKKEAARKREKTERERRLREAHAKALEERKRQDWKLETQNMSVFARAAYWWAKQLSPSGEWDNGDKGTSDMVGALVAMNRELVSAEKIQSFQQALTMELENAKVDYRGIVRLSVDYHPTDPYLSSACAASGINGMDLPCKTGMEINPSTWSIILTRGYWKSEEI